MGRRAQGGPRRTCIGCRAVRAQANLIRLEATAGGGIAFDPAVRRGRGAYLCPVLACLERAIKRRALPLALEAGHLRQAFSAALVGHTEGRLQAEPGAADRGNGRAAV